jgi:membrane-anchored glycerophosphoryl diester phosphodiesterase (GDPDase)
MSNSSKLEVRIGDWIGEGWKMFTEQWKSWVTLSLSIFVVAIVPIVTFMVIMYVMMFATMMAQRNSRGVPPQMPLMPFLILYGGMFALIIVLMPLSVLLLGGAYRAAFKQLRGGLIEFRDLFSAKDCYWRLLGATLMHLLLGAIGAMLCVIPAFIVGGLLFFTVPLIVERNLGVFEAMRASRDMAQRNLLMFTLFAFVVQLIASVGTYACYVGLLATWPLMFTITAVAYRDCFGVSGARSFSQTVPSTPIGYAPTPADHTQTPQQQALACPNCQTSLPAAAQFCPRCGTDVSA